LIESCEKFQRAYDEYVKILDKGTKSLPASYTILFDQRNRAAIDIYVGLYY